MTDSVWRTNPLPKDSFILDGNTQVELMEVGYSNIDAVGQMNNTLYILFFNGMKYRYNGVSSDTYMSIMNGGNIGRDLITLLKTLNGVQI